MNFNKRSNNPGVFRRQKGIATILMVVMMGIALTATSLSYIHSLRSNQETHLALHASTHAQNGVWLGVEAFRRYLGGLDSTDLEALKLALAVDPNLEYSIAFGDSGTPYGSLTAKNFNITMDGNIYRFSAEIVNLHEAAQSSSAVGVMYEIRPKCDGCVELANSLDFYDDLHVTGGISMLAPDGAKANVNVDGNITIENVSINDMGRLAATGNVTLSSGVAADHIYANGNVIVTGGAVVQKVEARGTVSTDGGGGAVVIWANGDVTLTGTLRAQAVNSRAKITARKGAHGLLKAGGDVSLEYQVTGTFGDIMSAGNISVSKYVYVGDVVGEKSFTCPGTNWLDFNSLSVQSVFSPCVEKTLVDSGKTTLTPNNKVEVMQEIQPFVVPPTVVDVWALRSKANYILEWDSTNSRIKATVQHVHGHVDGDEFYIADYQGVDPVDGAERRDHLCKRSSGTYCVEPATPTIPICLGTSPNNNCITYDTRSNTFTFSGTATVPGIIWVKGNLKLDGGYNYSTFLATGNITTAGSQIVEAVNYAGYSEVCLATGADIHIDDKPFYTSRFSVYYPTQLCDKTGSGTYTPIPTGNIALAAGGYDPAGTGVFTGGNIAVSAAITIYGTVLAGNYLNTSGATQIFGYAMAASQGDNTGLTARADRNKLGASTVIDLTNLPAGYDPAKVPDMGGSGGNTGGQSGGAAESTSLLWSRYL